MLNDEKSLNINSLPAAAGAAVTPHSLPRLKPKQQAFVMQHILLKEEHPAEAYRRAYNADNMNPNSLSREAQKLLKNPNLTPWLEYYRINAQKAIDEEFKYTANDAFKELNELQKRSMYSSKTYSTARACIDSKCKIAGLYNEKPVEVNANIKMPEITISGENIKFEIGGVNNPPSSASQTLPPQGGQIMPQGGAEL